MSPVVTTIDWQGITLSVGHTPNWYGVDVHHIELHVLAPEGAILPVTDTGYRSHFVHEDMEQYGGAIGFVRAWLDAEAASPKWKRLQEQARQLHLF